ncbi:hypothetical protein BJ165DRAFT_1515734 [Panaeolus papilionaceus]|nr:hypothetical protein BJ165DRAFT_1515734 [Panaeolus papilionaceus]
MLAVVFSIFLIFALLPIPPIFAIFATTPVTVVVAVGYHGVTSGACTGWNTPDRVRR